MARVNISDDAEQFLRTGRRSADDMARSLGAASILMHSIAKSQGERMNRLEALLDEHARGLRNRLEKIDHDLPKDDARQRG